MKHFFYRLPVPISANNISYPHILNDTFSDYRHGPDPPLAFGLLCRGFYYFIAENSARSQIGEYRVFHALLHRALEFI
jgi:hypothetical protein